MIVYKMNRAGFIEELSTDGNYKPVGWSTDRATAKRKGDRQKANLRNTPRRNGKR